MAKTGNKITITLDAYDIFNVLGILGAQKAVGILPKDALESYEKMKINVLMNCSHDAG